MQRKTLAFLPIVCGTLVAPILAQVAWQPRSPALHPAPRTMHAMVYDTAANRVLLFGGADGPGTIRFQDTWEWNGTDWTQRVPVVAPPARNGHGMAYDTARRRAVVFGGIGTFGALADTWEWDGTNWQQRSPAHAPSARTSRSMAYDTTRNRTVLFGGGLSGNPVLLADTWEWNGTDWLQRAPALAPPGSDAAAMVYDSARSVAVLFVPVISGGTLAGAQTWEWDGTNWSARPSPTMPSARRLPCMAYDSQRQRTVLFGGHHDPSSTFLADTWEWDGTHWTQPSLAVHPSGRGQAAMAYDAGLGRSVLFGGVVFWGNNEVGDTWEYGPHGLLQASYAPFGQGCTGHFGVPVLAAANSRPVLGTTFALSVTNLPPDHLTTLWLGFSDAAWVGGPLPYDLGVLGMTYCTLYVSGDHTALLLNWGGTAHGSLAIPNAPQLLGLQFYNQAGTIDRVNPLGMIVSNAGRARIGDY